MVYGDDATVVGCGTRARFLRDVLRGICDGWVCAGMF